MIRALPCCPLHLALRRDTYGRDDFSPNDRHSAIVNPAPDGGICAGLARPGRLPVYPGEQTFSPWEACLKRANSGHRVIVFFLLSDISTHRGEFLLMCSDGTLNGGEPSTAPLRLDFDKELNKLAVKLATGVDRYRQGIEVCALDAEKVRRNVLKASEVDCSSPSIRFQIKSSRYIRVHRLAPSHRAIGFPSCCLDPAYSTKRQVRFGVICEHRARRRLSRLWCQQRTFAIPGLSQIRAALGYRRPANPKQTP